MAKPGYVLRLTSDQRSFVLPTPEEAEAMGVEEITELVEVCNKLSDTGESILDTLGKSEARAKSLEVLADVAITAGEELLKRIKELEAEKK